MSIDAGYIAGNRRFSVAAGKIVEPHPESDLIRVVWLRLAHWNIWILGRIDRILDGSWRGLHWSPERVWKHVESPGKAEMRKMFPWSGRKKAGQIGPPLGCDDSQLLNEGCCCFRWSRKKTNCHGESLKAVCYPEPWFAAKPIQGWLCSVSRWAKLSPGSWCSDCRSGK
jgi:hypothetical protein